MVKSYAGLWPTFISWENMQAAYRKCRRRKRYDPDAAAFDYAWESNLLNLLRELEDGGYRPGPYRNFFIVDPKRRKISAAPFRDRVLHHAVVRILEPIFESKFIYDSYACRRRKGTHRAVDRAQQYMHRYDYYLKTDIVRFFPNVDHEILLRILRRTIRDERLMALIEQIVASGAGVLADEATPRYFPGDDLFSLLRPTGLPIGNLTSQFFANVLLDQVDHFVKEVLRVPGYVRYADDMVLFGPDKESLWNWFAELQKFMAGQRLTLHPKKTQLRPCSRQLKFLGLILSRSGRRLQQSSIRRFNARLRTWRWLKANRGFDGSLVGASIKAWLAHARRANSVGVRRAIWRRVRM
jgi:hypothetical protein